MSILLEALRKSEKNQQPREVPTIHTGDQADPVREPFRRGPLVLLLVAALAVIGWFVWRQYQPPAGYEPPVTLRTADEKVVNEPPAGDGDAGPAAPRNATGARPAPRNRTPVESYQPPGSSTPQVSSQRAATGTETVPAAPASDTNQPRSIVQRLASARHNRVNAAPNTDAEPAATPAGDRQEAVTSRQPSRPEDKARDPRETEPISYWELPDAIRSSVPEFRFSVLVYAQDPADRFVLIDGQRLGEGDTVQPGLEVKEIRLDGVVFSYRLYQFLVER